MRNFILTLFLAFLGFLGSMGVCEISVRLLKLAPEISPIVINKPWGDFETVRYKNIRYLPKKGSPDINSFGLKDREFKLNKDPGTYRIIVLGDSIVYGLCYQPNHLKIGSRVSEKLQNLLNEYQQARGNPLKYEVYNFGVSGFDAEQEADLIELKALQFKPDLVVQVYCLNDDTEMSAEIDDLNDAKNNSKWKKLKDFESAYLSRYLMWSHFYRLIYQRVGALFQNKTESSEAVDDRAGLPVIRAYDHLKELAADNGFKVLVVAQPLIVDAASYIEEWEHDRTKRLAEERGFGFIDMLPEYKSRFGANIEPVSCGDILHPNEFGHQLLAEKIFEEVRNYNP